jgi:methylenetetrahydrofolate dehydrogenase (NADP+)/methenyltetrahydrofolate cyclohydrolase
MSAKLIDGKNIAEEIRKRVTRDVASLGYAPGLAVIIVGDDPASEIYVRLKEKACRDAGVHFERLSFKNDASAALIVRAIENLNRRQDIDGILVQLPLPDHLDEHAIIRSIDPQKDVDGFHPENLADLKNGSPRVIPGLAAGILALVKSTGETLAGRSAVVVANSETFFEPLDIVLRSAGMKTAYVAPDANPETETRAADVVIIAVGRPSFLTPQMIKPGAIVIDVGTNRVGTKIVGDAAPDIIDAAGRLTPVPGGVGPMTIAMLLKNLADLAAKRRGHR